MERAPHTIAPSLDMEFAKVFVVLLLLAVTSAGLESSSFSGASSSSGGGGDGGRRKRELFYLCFFSLAVYQSREQKKMLLIDPMPIYCGGHKCSLLLNKRQLDLGQNFDVFFFPPLTSIKHSSRSPQPFHHCAVQCKYFFALNKIFPFVMRNHDFCSILRV